MGYYTRYSLTVAPEYDATIRRAFADVYSLAYHSSPFAADHPAGQYQAEFGVKWYNWRDHCAEVSQAHPTIEFVVAGVGEDDGDVWSSTWLGGFEVATGSIEVTP